MEGQSSTDQEDLSAVLHKAAELDAEPASDVPDLSAKPAATSNSGKAASSSNSNNKSSSGGSSSGPGGKSSRHSAFFFDAEFMLYKYKVRNLKANSRSSTGGQTVQCLSISHPCRFERFHLHSMMATTDHEFSAGSLCMSCMPFDLSHVLHAPAAAFVIHRWSPAWWLALTSGRIVPLFIKGSRSRGATPPFTTLTCAVPQKM
jgi:hypothetical protein